jgi:hypothetical protein
MKISLDAKKPDRDSRSGQDFGPQDSHNSAFSHGHRSDRFNAAAGITFPPIQLMPPRWAKLRNSIRRIQNASHDSTGRLLPCLTMSSNGAIRFAAAAASAVAIPAFGAGAPNFQPATIIVVATTQMAVTRVILRIANLLPRPDALARGAGKLALLSPRTS